MTNADALERLQSIFNDIFLEPVQLTRALSAADVPEWDSLMQVSLVMAVERAFAVRFRVGEVEATRNVGEFVDLIIRRSSER